MKFLEQVRSCWFRHIVMLVAFLPAIASCGNDAAVLDGDGSAAGEGQVQICFTISMAGSTAGTRAITWGDTYTPVEATTEENAIDPGKFQVLVFDTSGKYLDQLGNLSCTRSSGNDGTYEVVGTLPVDNSYVENGKLSCKLVVLANYDEAVDVSKNPTLGGLKDLTSFSYENHKTADIASGAAQIPMLGVATLTNLKMNAGYRTDAGTIYMLRAMAKIVVNLNLDSFDSNGNGVIDTGEKFAIESVSLTNCNTTGYIMPRGFADTSVSNTTDLTMVDLDPSSSNHLNWDEDNTFNPYPSNDSDTPTTIELTFQKKSDTEFYAYVPEYKYETDTERPQFSIRFDYMTGSADPYTFDFDEYEDGKAKGTENYNIERNHVYTFTITKGKGSFSINTDDWANTFNNEYTF